MIIPIITGPTGTGKTALSIETAIKFNAEIISADAYQVYKGMDIGTGKATKDEMQGVSHHLIDILNPDETYSAGSFFAHAETCITDIISRGKMPIIAGGTGLYAETLIKGIFNAPERDDSYRLELEAEGEQFGFEKLHERLSEIDPEFAFSIAATDKTRIIRGLEINKQCQMTVREAQATFHIMPKYKYAVFLLSDEREQMYARINDRVANMFAKGWVDEVKALLASGYDDSLQSFKAIGYRETAELIRGEVVFKDVLEKVQQKTRNFAKRQVTWFKHMQGLNELKVGDNNNIHKVSEFISNYWT